MVDKGGHNILEPLYFSKPTLFGPFMSNFSEIEEFSLKHEACLRVGSKDELKTAVLALLKDKSLREKFSNNALGLFEGAGGSLDKNLKLIEKHLKPNE